MFGWRRYVPFRVYFNTDTACAQQRLGSNKAETSLYLPGYGWLNVCAHRSGPENEDKDRNIWITIGFNPTRRAGDQEKYLFVGRIEDLYARYHHDASMFEMNVPAAWNFEDGLERELEYE